MADEPTRPVIVEAIPSIAGGISAIASANAPVIYFEDAPFFGLLNGIGKVTIQVSRHAARAPDGGVLADYIFVAHLAGNVPAIRNLRAALDGILLMAEPKPESPAN
jgi:hypothetical protein